MTLAALAVSAQPAQAAQGTLGPMYYLTTFGARGAIVDPLLWGLFILAIVVVVVISGLVIVGIMLRARSVPFGQGQRVDVARGEGGLAWVYGGLIVTTIILLGFVAWTMMTMVSLSSPATPTAFTIHVTGTQWWWKLNYEAKDPSKNFVTANEIHIPVGVPVRLVLSSDDVIHSFWVPALAGKTDLIPNRTNHMWIEGDHVGVYRGQCAEYCGTQHAHMALRVFVDTPADFQAWWNNELREAMPPQSQSAQEGQKQFLQQCGICHTVRGTPAHGKVGPELTHVMSRSTLAADMLPNTVANLSGWIANPQQIKPGSRMPNLDLSAPQLAAIRDYLLTLK